MGRVKQKVPSESGSDFHGVSETKSKLKGGGVQRFQHGQFLSIPIEMIEPNPWNP